MRITKLDRRHTGYGKYAHMIEVDSVIASVQIFHTWRSWCWQTFGPGIELRYAMDPRSVSLVLPIELPTKWAWQTEFGHIRLYFQDEATTSMFLLQWKK